MIKYILLLVAVWSVQGKLKTIEEGELEPGPLSPEEAVSDGGPAKRIIGGKDVSDGDLPYQVSLRTTGNNSFHYCSGGIISPTCILTTGHCIANKTSSSLFAVVGSVLLSEGTKHEIKKLIIHEDYFVDSIKNDVGILVTALKMEYNDKVQPIALATKAPKTRANCLVSGWGSVTRPKNLLVPDRLQRINLTIWDQSNCDDYYHAVLRQGENKKICGINKFGQGLCFGDSGGMLVDQNEAVGIASIVTPCAYGSPDFYSNIFLDLDWIMKTMDANKDQ